MLRNVRADIIEVSVRFRMQFMGVVRGVLLLLRSDKACCRLVNGQTTICLRSCLRGLMKLMKDVFAVCARLLRI